MSFKMKLLAMFFFVFIVKEIRAQGFEKNQFSIIANVGLDNEIMSGKDKTSYYFGLDGGLFVSNCVNLGLNFGVNNIADISDNFFMRFKSTFYATPKNKFSLFGSISAGYFETKLQGEQFKGYDFFINPGVNYFVTDAFAINASVGNIGYKTYKSDSNKNIKSEEIKLDFNFSQITIGLLYRHK